MEEDIPHSKPEGVKFLSRRKVDKYTKEWAPDLDMVLPLSGDRDIPNFKAWINWNGFNLDESGGQTHRGFDFAAYLTTDNRIVLGLPRDTKVRAIADGRVAYAMQGRTKKTSDYYSEIRIEHGGVDSGMISRYGHVVPSVKTGRKVRKGDVIGTLYTSRGEDLGYLVHLHLTLYQGLQKGEVMDSALNLGLNPKLIVDPRIIDKNIYRYSAIPQGKTGFTVTGLGELPVEVANFNKLIL